MIFDLVENNNEMVIVGIKEGLSPLDIARHPYISSEMKYITITRGKNHVMTVVKNDGKTWSISFGESGYTLVSDNVQTLKNKVLEFIKTNGILIDNKSTEIPTKATVYFNKNFNKWQISFGHINGAHVFTFVDEAKSLDDTLKYAEKIYNIKAINVKKNIAPTGITVFNVSFKKIA